MQASEWVHPDRTVAFDVMAYITEGALYIYEDNTEYDVKKGDVFFLKSGMHHWGQKKSLPETKWYWIHFFNQMDKIGKPFFEEHAILNKNIYSRDDYDKYLILPKQINLAPSNLLTNQFEELIRTFRSNDPYKQIKMSLAMVDMLLEICKLSNLQKQYSNSDILVQKMIKYLNILALENKRFVADGFSDELRMNYCYLSKIFHDKVGISIKKYYTKLIINIAARYLRESRLNISEVSDLTGFENVYYFSRVFKKIVGICPTEYIKNNYVRSLNEELQ